MQDGALSHTHSLPMQSKWVHVSVKNPFCVQKTKHFLFCNGLNHWGYRQPCTARPHEEAPTPRVRRRTLLLNGGEGKRLPFKVERSHFGGDDLDSNLQGLTP